MTFELRVPGEVVVAAVTCTGRVLPTVYLGLGCAVSIPPVGERVRCVRTEGGREILSPLLDALLPGDVLRVTW